LIYDPARKSGMDPLSLGILINILCGCLSGLLVRHIPAGGARKEESGLASLREEFSRPTSIEERVRGKISGALRSQIKLDEKKFSESRLPSLIRDPILSGAIPARGALFRVSCVFSKPRLTGS